MALAKATTNKKHSQDPIALDPVFLAPYRQTLLYKPRLSICQFLPRLGTLKPIYNPFFSPAAKKFYPRVPFVIRKFHGPVPDNFGTANYCALAYIEVEEVWESKPSPSTVYTDLSGLGFTQTTLRQV